MKYILLYQHSCDACSEVARTIRALSVPELEARPRQDPRVRELLEETSRPVPDRPSLLIIDEDGLDVVSGWEMRRRLAGIIGWRRAGTISRLAAAEGRARLRKLAGPSQPTRRRILAGGVATGLVGGLAWALRSSGHAAAALQSDAAGPAVTQASADETREILATAPVQRAISTWGPASKIYKIGTDAKDLFVVEHSRTSIVTLASFSSDAARGDGKATAWSLGPTPGGHGGYRSYLVSGAAIADTAPDGTVTAAYEPGTEPDGITASQLKLFIGCLGRNVTLFCLQTCVTCLTTKNAAYCSYCISCADVAWTACVKDIIEDES